MSMYVLYILRYIINQILYILLQEFYIEKKDYYIQGKFLKICEVIFIFIVYIGGDYFFFYCDDIVNFYGDKIFDIKKIFV